MVDGTPAVVAAGQGANLQISIGGGAALENVVRGMIDVREPVRRKSVGEGHQVRLEILIRKWDHVDRGGHGQIRPVEQTGPHMALSGHEIDGGGLHGHAITGGKLRRRVLG